MLKSGIRESDNSLAGYEVLVRTTGRDDSVKTDWFDCLDVCGSDAFSTFFLDNAYNINPNLDQKQMEMIKVGMTQYVTKLLTCYSFIPVKVKNHEFTVLGLVWSEKLIGTQ